METKDWVVLGAASFSAFMSAVTAIYVGWRSRLTTKEVEAARMAFELQKLELDQSFRGQIEAFNDASRARQREASESFSREQAEHAREFQRALETMRAELATDVELRRAVAQRTVTALEELFSQGEPLLRVAMNRDLTNPGRGVQATLQFLELIRARQHLLPNETVKALHRYNGELARAAADFEKSGEYEPVDRASKLQREFVDLIRVGLRVSSAASIEGSRANIPSHERTEG
jgi:hypothetical protein